MAQEIADDPEGPFKEYNAAIRSLKAEAPSVSHREVKAKLRGLSRAPGLRFPKASQAEHEGIMDALRARDTDRAAKLALWHKRSVGESVGKLVADAEAEGGGTGAA